MCAVCARLVSLHCNHWYTAFLAVTFFFRGQPELSDVMWSFVCDTRIILAIAVISSRCGVVSRQHTSNLVPSFMLNIFFFVFRFCMSVLLSKKDLPRGQFEFVYERILTCDVWLNCYTWLQSIEILSKMSLEIGVYLPISCSVHMSVCMMEHCFFRPVLKLSLNAFHLQPCTALSSNTRCELY